jgi:hypothetical protein
MSVHHQRRKEHSRTKTALGAARLSNRTASGGSSGGGGGGEEGALRAALVKLVSADSLSEWREETVAWLATHVAHLPASTPHTTPVALATPVPVHLKTTLLRTLHPPFVAPINHPWHLATILFSHLATTLFSHLTTTCQHVL